MNDIILHGVLAEQFGARHRYHVGSPHEAIRALAANKPGFTAAIRDMELRLIRSKPGVDCGIALDQDDLQMGMHDAELHIIPMPAGSEKNGVTKIIIGIVLIAAVILTNGGAAAFMGAGGGTAGVGAAWAAGAGGTFLGISGGTVMLAGAAIALGGVAMMMAPSPKKNEADQKASFLFSGVTNATEQGVPVPLVYGLTLTGSVVIGLGLATESISVQGTPFNGSIPFGGAFGDMWAGDLLFGDFIGGINGVGGQWVVTTEDNTIEVLTTLNLAD